MIETQEQTGSGLIQTRTATLDDLRRHADAGHLYAILDACDQPEVPIKVWELGEHRAVSLYRGIAEEEFWDIAPYLVKVDGALLDWIVDTLWEEPWGIFAVSTADLDTMRRHFRRFLVVEDPDGEQMYFRFYDPRVLPTFMHTCSQVEVAEIFGPVPYYLVFHAMAGASLSIV